MASRGLHSPLFFCLGELILSKPIEVILAATPKGEIGYNNAIPWHLKGDLQRFRHLTMGQIVVMGKNTYQSLPKPLVGRQVIVVSASLAQKSELDDDVHFVSSLREALLLAKSLPGKKIMIAGGVTLYQAVLQFPCIVHLTLVFKQSLSGYDTVIKNFNMNNFNLGYQFPVLEQNETTGLVEISHIYCTYVSKSLGEHEKKY